MPTITLTTPINQFLKQQALDNTQKGTLRTALGAADVAALNGSAITTGTVPLARLVNTLVFNNDWGAFPTTIPALTRDVLINFGISAARSMILPEANYYPAGARVSISDMVGGISSINTLTINIVGADTINGATSLVISTANASVMLISDGVSKWNVDIRGVSRGGTGSTNGSITGTTALAFTAGGTAQNITLTPSTTGLVSVVNGTTGQRLQVFGSSSGANTYGLEFVGSGAGSVPTLKSIATGTFASGGYGLILDTADTSGQISIRNAGTSKLIITSSAATFQSGTAVTIASTLAVTGGVTLGKIITASGTTGAREINQTTGSVNFAAAATSLVVTNNLCTANSIITVSIGTNDATANGLRVIAGAGSFTIHFQTSPTAETRVNFRLTN